MIPGKDANALSANLPSSCDRAFNLFFIHSLAPLFLSLVVVLCDVGVDALGPPSRALYPCLFIQEFHDRFSYLIDFVRVSAFQNTYLIIYSFLFVL